MIRADDLGRTKNHSSVVEARFTMQGDQLSQAEQT